MQTIQGVLQLQYDILGFKIAAQGGPASGQSVLHVHVHIMPINNGDLYHKNKIYDRLEAWAPQADHHLYLQKLDITKEEARRYQTVEYMREEDDLCQGRLVGNIASLN